MRLVIQSNLPGELQVWIVDRNGAIVAARQRRTRYHQSEHVLRLIEKLLQSQRISILDIQNILVVRGPGPFSAIRTGLIVANTLGWLHGIPVQGTVTTKSLKEDPERLAMFFSKQQKIVRPWYGRKPNITKSKRR